MQKLKDAIKIQSGSEINKRQNAPKSAASRIRSLIVIGLLVTNIRKNCIYS
jgi:hypothetical protein